MTSVTQSALARRLNVTRQAVHDLVKRRVLEPDANGLIDLDLAKHALERKTRPSGKTAAALEPPAPADQETHHAARTRRERAEADLAELKLAEQRGEVIRTAAVRATWAASLASARDRLLTVPDRCAAVLAAEGNPQRVHELLTKEIHAAMSELAGERQNK
jgi:phage terminase Nu1 subunit (DNA packaging protein)